VPALIARNRAPRHDLHNSKICASLGKIGKYRTLASD